MTKENKKKDMEGVRKAESIAFGAAKNKYIRNIINARYFFERTNMIAEQINNGKIIENIDGCTKPEAFMRSEYALQKMQAITEMRNAHFAKLDLAKDFKFTDEDIQALEEDYYNGKIVRDSYDDEYKKGKTAKFVNKSKD